MLLIYVVYVSLKFDLLHYNLYFVLWHYSKKPKHILRTFQYIKLKFSLISVTIMYLVAQFSYKTEI